MPPISAIQHAFDVLDAPCPPLPAIVVLLGDDRFLKRLVLSQLLNQDHEADYSAYVGEERAWADISDELLTASLFSPGPRCVLINDADAFVSRNRGELESFVAQPARGGTLILELSSLPSNTRLYRAVVERGWLIECRQPEVKHGNSRSPDVKRMKKWLESSGAWAPRDSVVT